MVRTADTSEAEAIADIAAAAFGFAHGGERWQRIARQVQGSPGDYLVVEHRGRVAGSLHLVPHRVFVEDAVVQACDVHDVSVDPNLQGRGLGTELLAAAVDEMARRGFHFSRLGGYARFYSRFGYCRFPRGAYELPVEPAEAGARVLGVEEVFALPDRIARHVRRYDPANDWHACQRLWQGMYSGRTGAPVRPYDSTVQPPAQGPDPRALKFVYDDGAVRGYVFATVTREGRVFRPCDGRVAVAEAAFEPGCPEALWAPMKRVLQEAARMNSWRVLAQLPFDPVVERALSEGAITFRRVELMGGPASNMVRVLNLAGLLETIEAVLRRRAETAPQPDHRHIRLTIGSQAATLSFDAAKPPSVTASAPDGPSEDTATAQLDSYGVMAMVLGLRTWGELAGLCKHDLSAADGAALDALFPRQPTATGPWG